ncbi:C3HC zinc finger-like-domain-containing protein [Boletus reticuloceps]|uniref:C3HC zinc finger-like-domain-containing protein n=1 Tax=Boletus reticuloceps TaxID=495285 RepID=A0A8I3A6D9_9AGAM|nr:C3HC zinc finger-like-domain-containing protein [Boletus reticuloceps]
MEPNVPTSISSVRTTKRKLEAAIRTLDEAVVSPPLASTIERPTPSKRPHLTPSVYSTLAKFGRTPKERSLPSSESETPSSVFSSTIALDVSKSAPHLAAILARSVLQSKQVHLSSHPSTPHPVSEYRPSSTDSFLSRLATYKITTYANKPPQIDAVAAARCGWINGGKDRLVCGMCDVSWVLAGREGMNKDAASALIEKQRMSFVEMHKDGCPWKARQCELSVYRVPLQTPTAMVHELRAKTLSLEHILADVAIKHPLTPSQLSSLRSIFSVAAPQRSVSEHDSTRGADETTHPAVPSDTAILVALFGWVPAPTMTHHRTTSLSISRAGSFGPSASMPPTPSLSRNQFHLEPLPRAGKHTNPLHVSADEAFSHTKSPLSNSVSTATAPRDVPVVYCVLCQRRVGLWGYSASKGTTSFTQDEHSATVSREHQKEFDVVKEHRSYCPYIVCSSVVPSFSHSPVVDSHGNAIEGWRAVLTVVQRYDLSQRQRLSRFLPSDDLDNQASSTELNGVKAMVAGVKTSGGRELLKYVKAVLG